MIRALRIIGLVVSCAVPLTAQELPQFDVLASAPIAGLSFNPVDAEFSKSLNAVVAVSASPHRLNIYRPDSQTVSEVVLASAPLSVSVSPDGNYAAVGHSQSVTYVNLVTATVVKTWTVNAIAGDIVLGGNGYIYVIPSSGSWSVVLCINVTTDAITQQTGYTIYGGSRAKLHPSGTSIYSANNGLSPSDIEKLSIANGTAVYAYDSPYHGDYPMCGNLWIAEDGARIFTRCGNTFRASATRSEDMIYAGHLGNENLIRWLSHSTAASTVALLPEFYAWTPGPRGDNEVRYYTEDYLAYRGKVILPVFAGTSAPSRGRWMFFNSAGTKQYVVVQADAGYGQVPEYGVVTLDCTSATVTPMPASMNVAAAAATLQFNVMGTAGCGWKATPSTPWISTLSSGVSDGTVSFTVTANSGVASRSGTITVGGATFTVTQAGVQPVSVAARATSPSSVSLTWSSGSVDHFEVWRNSGGGYVKIAEPVTPSFVDGVSPNGAYLYKVLAVMTGGGASPFSTPDYAHTFALTDASLAAGTTIRAAHMTELRTVANALRAVAGLGATAFTDPSLTGVVAKRIHVTELRDTINGLRATLGMPSWAYSTLNAGSVIQPGPTLELRASVE